jgi:hypothetical protein
MIALIATAKALILYFIFLLMFNYKMDLFQLTIIYTLNHIIGIMELGTINFKVVREKDVKEFR